MLNILRILCYVYEFKYMKGATLKDGLLFKNDINQVFNKNTKLANQIFDDSASKYSKVYASSSDFNPKVPSAIDLKETFETLHKTAQKLHSDHEIMQLVVVLMCLYSESQHKLSIVAVDYILPSI